MSFFEILPPSVLFFALGFAAAALRSDLSVPDALAKALSLYLMMAIGLKGGIAIAQPGASAGLIPALFDWTPITWSDMPATLGVGVSALGAHYGLTNALKRADTTVVIPLDFLRLPLIATVGFLFYAEAFDPFVLIGGGLIFVGILYSLRWERQVS
jgi:drug/metabolite transporter (DMT)-like permease